MLIIRTGKPGHGKTLNAIREIDWRAHTENRVVYFHNVTGLKTDALKAQWYEFEDPEKWFELPNDAIIVIDEAQGWFGVRDPRQRPPEHITRFEVIRKQGHEVHLISQDPRFLDSHLRRLCNGHIHFWRVFKSGNLLRFESEAVIEKVEVMSSFKDADKKRIRLDRRYFDLYKSANAKHHFQTKIPTKFLLAVGVIFVAAFMVYRVYERYLEGQAVTDPVASKPSIQQEDKPLVDQVKSSVGSIIGSATHKAGSGNSEGKKEDTLTTEDYIALRTPRITDVPSSAPLYDELTKPVAYPKLSCFFTSDERYIANNSDRFRVVKSDKGAFICECYTQQGTYYETSFQFCRNVVERGYFDPARPDLSRQLAQTQSSTNYRGGTGTTTPNTPTTSSPFSSGAPGLRMERGMSPSQPGVIP